MREIGFAEPYRAAGSDPVEVRCVERGGKRDEYIDDVGRRDERGDLGGTAHGKAIGVTGDQLISTRWQNLNRSKLQ